MRFCARKNKKENEKNGEKTITEDACVCLCDISYSHFIVQHKQKFVCLSRFIFLSIPPALPSRLLKMRPTEISIAMGRRVDVYECLVYGLQQHDAKQIDRYVVCLDINHGLHVHKRRKELINGFIVVILETQHFITDTIIRQLATVRIHFVDCGC